MGKKQGFVNGLPLFSTVQGPEMFEALSFNHGFFPVRYVSEMT